MKTKTLTEVLTNLIRLGKHPNSNRVFIRFENLYEYLELSFDHNYDCPKVLVSCSWTAGFAVDYKKGSRFISDLVKRIYDESVNPEVRMLRSEKFRGYRFLISTFRSEER